MVTKNIFNVNRFNIDLSGKCASYIIVNDLRIDLCKKSKKFKEIIRDNSPVLHTYPKIKTDTTDSSIKLCDWKDEKFGIPVLVLRIPSGRQRKPWACHLKRLPRGQRKKTFNGMCRPCYSPPMKVCKPPCKGFTSGQRKC